MTTTLAVLSADALRYVLPHVSKEESRPTLNGVYCEPSGVLVATSRHTLCMHVAGSEGVTRPVILKFEKPASVTARKVDHITIDLPTAPDYRTPIMATLRTSSGVFLGVAVAYEIEGPYANFRAVLPKEDTDAPQSCISLDPAKLDRFTMEGDRVTLDFYGPTAAIGVRYYRNASVFGLIMPTTHTAEGGRSWTHGSATYPPRPLGATHLSAPYAAEVAA